MGAGLAGGGGGVVLGPGVPVAVAIGVAALVVAETGVAAGPALAAEVGVPPEPQAATAHETRAASNGAANRDRLCPAPAEGPGPGARDGKSDRLAGMSALKWTIVGGSWSVGMVSRTSGRRRRFPWCAFRCRRRSLAQMGAGTGPASGPSDAGGPREFHAAVCARCGGRALVPFSPRFDKPVYSSPCFDKVKPIGAPTPAASA